MSVCIYVCMCNVSDMCRLCVSLSRHLTVGSCVRMRLRASADRMGTTICELTRACADFTFGGVESEDIGVKCMLYSNEQQFTLQQLTLQRDCSIITTTATHLRSRIHLDVTSLRQQLRVKEHAGAAL